LCSGWLITAQIELKLKYKFRLILDETWSFGVLGRTGRGVTEHQHVDAAEVDMIVGSMAGPLSAAGGFCAGSDEVVEHQRLSAASYTFSAALPAMSAVTASETLMMLQTQPDLFAQLKENIKAMWAQLDPRSDWIHCTSATENPIMLLVLKPEVISSRRLNVEDQQQILQDIVDEVSPIMWALRCILLTSVVVSRTECSDHTRQESACRSVRRKDGYLFGSPGFEGLCYDRPDEEGDRKGGHYNSACYHENPGQEAVIWLFRGSRCTVGL
jgi:hypothetical protein